MSENLYLAMKTLVLGASPNSVRFSYRAVKLLKRYDHEVVPVGIRKGLIGDEEIILGKPDIAEIHTVTLYVGPKRQVEYYEYILSLNPRRIIFNPGTENDEFQQMAVENEIETVLNCTLVMLKQGIF